MNPDERIRRIGLYAQGPDRLEAAVGAVPEAARKFRPASGKWSVHEIVIHCADAESNSHMRLRYLLAEDDPRSWVTTRIAGLNDSTITPGRCPRRWRPFGR